jgi:outer membrane protein insertion porin family
MRKRCRSVFGLWSVLLWIGFFLCGIPATALTANPLPPSASIQAQQDSSVAPVVRSIRFAGNKNVGNYTLETLIRTRTNREFLGIPSLTPRYYIWQLNLKIGKRLGEPPIRLDREVLSRDMERIVRYYEGLGYRETTVDTVVNQYAKHKVEITFIIDEGPVSYLRNLYFTGMPKALGEDRIRSFYRRSPLTGKAIADTAYRVNQQFTYEALSQERTRIINYLKNNGYASVQRDSVNAQVRPDPDRPRQLDVLFTIRPGHTYTFGDVQISLASSTKPGEYNQFDTLSGPPHTVDDKKIILNKHSSTKTDYDLLTRQLLFKPGNIFNNERYIRSIREYQNLGMLSVMRFGLSEDGGLPDYSRNEIPVTIELQSLPRQQVRTKFFGLQRFGFGAGAGITYLNNNLFGQAEQLELGVNWNVEYVGAKAINDYYNDNIIQGSDSQVLQSFETRADYSVPRLNFPFKKLDRRLFFSNARTNYSLSYRQSNQLNFDINADIRFNLQYQLNHSPSRTSFLDLLELDWLDAKKTALFERTLDEQFPDPNSLERRRIEEEFRSQFNSIIRYTLRTSTTDVVKRNEGKYTEYSFAIGGNLPFLMDRFLVTPDKLESSLPSLLRLSGNRLSYTQFIKLTADYRRYVPISENAVFAYRGYFGFAHPYGRNKTIPLNRKFFAGGSYDIRGWAPYNLGPGSIPPSQNTINGGEIKLAAFTELRQRFLQNVWAADWYAGWYVDAGNVWIGPANNFANDPNSVLDKGKFYFDRFYKQIAVSSGLGLRIDWDYVVVRLDWTRRVHDLQAGWFTNKDLYFSFGIGHSF